MNSVNPATAEIIGSDGNYSTETGCQIISEVDESFVFWEKTTFGGIRESGFGRELSVYGIKEFVNIKTVAIK